MQSKCLGRQAYHVGGNSSTKLKREGNPQRANVVVNKINKGQRKRPSVFPLGAGNGEKESMETLNEEENHRTQRKRFKKNELPRKMNYQMLKVKKSDG